MRLSGIREAMIEANHSRGFVGALRTQANEQIGGRIIRLARGAVGKSVDQWRQRRRLRQQCGAVRSARREPLQCLIETLAERFERREEERLVPRDRSAEVRRRTDSAERAASEARTDCGHRRRRSQKLEQIAVIRVGAARRRNNDLRSRSDPGLGGKKRGIHFELRN